MNSEAVAGSHSWVIYGEESTYNTAVARTVNFGIVTNFKHSVNNNLGEHRGFVGTTTGGRDIFKFTAGKLDLSLSVDFKVNRWQFMKFVLGTETGAGPYTYTGAALPPSLTISHNIDNPGSAATDLEETFSGCVVDSCNIKSSVGEPVTCTLDFKAALVVVDTTISSAVALPDEDVFNFTGGSIQLPSGSTLSNIIDSIDVTIKNNYDILYGVGSRLGRNALPKERNYTIKVTLKYLDNTLITAALGATTPTATGSPTETATLVLTYALGGKSMTMTFSGVPMSEFARVAELNNPIGEDITFTAKTLSAVDDRTA